MPLVSITDIPEISIADMNPFFHKCILADEEGLYEESNKEEIKEFLSKNPNLWTALYKYDLIDSSMIPETILDAEDDVPF